MSVYGAYGFFCAANNIEKKNRQQFLDAIRSNTYLFGSEDERRGQFQSLLFDLLPTLNAPYKASFFDYYRSRCLAIGIKRGVFKPEWAGLSKDVYNSYQAYLAKASIIETDVKEKCSKEELAGIEAVATVFLTGSYHAFIEKIKEGYDCLTTQKIGMIKNSLAYMQRQDSLTRSSQKLQKEAKRCFREWKMQTVANRLSAGIRMLIACLIAFFSLVLGLAAFMIGHYWSLLLMSFVPVFVSYGVYFSWASNKGLEMFSESQKKIGSKIESLRHEMQLIDKQIEKEAEQSQSKHIYISVEWPSDVEYDLQCAW